MLSELYGNWGDGDPYEKSSAEDVEVEVLHPDICQAEGSSHEL